MTPVFKVVISIFCFWHLFKFLLVLTDPYHGAQSEGEPLVRLGLKYFWLEQFSFAQFAGKADEKAAD